MKKFALGMIVATVMSAATVQAQEVAGTWQGSLQPPNAPNPLRIVLKISTEADQLKAVLYSIDQGAQPMNAGAVTFQSSTLKVTIPAISGSYEGKMSADGSSIVGTTVSADRAGVVASPNTGGTLKRSCSDFGAG